MQTSTAISRSTATALTDGGTAKDRHLLPAAATRRFDAILHVIEIVLRDTQNPDPATRVALARLTEALARIVDLPPQPQESLRDFTRRLAAHMDVLPPAARALIEKQLHQQPLLAALKVLVETLRPALAIDLRIDLPAMRDGPLHPDPVAALFPDEDAGPAFRQPTIQAPLPTRMAFSQAPGVAPGAPHLQQALGQAFSPEATAKPAQAAQAASPAAADGPDAPVVAGPPMLSVDEPVPPMREAAAFLASDAQALAQAVAIATRETVDTPLDLFPGQPPEDAEAAWTMPDGSASSAPDMTATEAADTDGTGHAAPGGMQDMPDAPGGEHRPVSSAGLSTLAGQAEASDPAHLPSTHPGNAARSVPPASAQTSSSPAPAVPLTETGPPASPSPRGAPAYPIQTAGTMDGSSGRPAGGALLQAISQPVPDAMPASAVPGVDDSPAMLPLAGEISTPRALPEQDTLATRHSATFDEAERAGDGRRVSDPASQRLDLQTPDVRIALMTASVREVANAIGQLDEWDTLFYMLSGSLTESPEATSSQAPHSLEHSPVDTGKQRPAHAQSAEADLTTISDEERITQSLVPQAQGEDALPAPPLARGMEAVIAREATGYPFVPYLPAADTGSQEVEDEEPRRQRRENEPSFAEGEDGESSGRDTGSSFAQDDRHDAEPSEADEPGERHDVYDLYQRLSDLP